MRSRKSRWLVAVAAATVGMGVTGQAQAQAQPGARYQIDLPAESLSAAILDLGNRTQSTIAAAPPVIEGKRAPAISGNFTVEEALEHLLTGSGLRIESVADGYVIQPASQSNTPNADIVVTGTRIAGAPIASPVISIDRSAMQESGFSDLGSVVRSVPQSFGGGQNPGVGTNVPSNRGYDLGGGSSVNLRGLGSDATLTLLDGQRVSYTASAQSIDVSAIPFGLVDHIDIVPDGASALYGSDAVAGVANVVLRRDMKGIETTTRVGGSTDGGNFQQQYGVAAGNSWKTGGLIVAYDRSSSDAVWGRQRSYTSAIAPNLMLMPQLWHDSVGFNGHQALASNLTFETSAYYNNRNEYDVFPQTVGSVLGSGQLATRDQVWGIASKLKLKLGADWHLNLQGSVGKDHVDLYNGNCVNGTCSKTSSSFYRNTAHSIEVNGDGKLFDLPGGPLKVALGAGYRSISLGYYAGSAITTIQRGQDSSYVFGELAIPVVGASQDVPFIKSLSVSAAVRYERYPGIDNVATPKFGLIYAPDDDFDFKASWGKSFRAPTLYEQYVVRGAYVYPATTFGVSGYPATAQAIYVVGGSPNLKPERANTWSAGMSFHPRSVPGAKLEVSYYNIHYRDRIVSPITVPSQALSNPIYASQITLAPDAATQAAVIASANRYLNVSSYPYAPANVVAIVNNSTVNAGNQWIQGVDILAEYERDLGKRDHLKVSVDVVYIDSRQQVSSSQPILPLAGTIFNPPHWRGQGFLTWKHDAMTVNLAAHYIGALTDNRTTTSYPIPSMTTFDTTIGYTFRRVFGPLQGLTLTLSAQNVFNAKPTQIAIKSMYDTPYDSTNYAPFGRVLSFGVNTKW
ncbi:TonB-dependent receptor [Novosphingobium rosa]|uniref:TonB-dependent receptor n=1 Tax=Novosphingobium rosa TaxID=76978 RepID=UPI000A02F3E8|nr:TonB-dependent receptor [Novosphingobium rosa]